MPYFKWCAVDRQGGVQRGITFARSSHALALKMRASGSEIITCTTYRSFRMWSEQITSHALALIFRQLSDMLSAGIPISEALVVVEQTTTHVYAKTILADCVQAVREGMLFSQALQFHGELGTSLTYALVFAAESSGRLAAACAEIAAYHEYMHRYSNRLRAALLVPGVTIICFVIVILIIFMGVIPRFAVLLYGLRRPLPWRTRSLLALSEWLRNWYTWGAIMGSSLSLLVLGRQEKLRQVWSACLLYVPYVRHWNMLVSGALFFKIVGMLLQQGVDMVQALSIAADNIQDAQWRSCYKKVTLLVQSGVTLSSALQQADGMLPPPCRALLITGENTGQLGPLVSKCAIYYEQEVHRFLHTLSQLVQPCLLVMLGIGIALVIIALYEPIFTFGNLI